VECGGREVEDASLSLKRLQEEPNVEEPYVEQPNVEEPNVMVIPI
jgi:hypothetical protein